MKKLAFVVLFLVSLAIPLLLYASALGLGPDVYGASVAFGIFAYVLVADQFFLAARPAFLSALIGPKGMTKLHASIPVLILAAAIAHRTLKVAAGFSLVGTQAALGGLALSVMLFVIIFAVLFMANTVWMRLKPVSALRDRVYRLTGLTYKGARVVHNLVLLAALALAFHVLIASTGDFAANPIGLFWMIGWMVLSLGLYLRYRLNGRRGGLAVAKTTHSSNA
ncbi:MAG TPA: hypothetical protein PLU93_08195 [Treponemataceae bacterium]|jgi:predicted ferric reductase|nr:hypothetical protein [Treponemataceae bacterium]